MPDRYERLEASLADRYALEGEIGRGGTAAVFLARDLKHDRAVAVKVLRPELAAAVGSDRFLVEIRITASLNHPHILPLLDSGESDGMVFYVMPYVAGGSLRRRISSAEPLPLEVVTAVTEQVAAALDYAHHQGVVHRDIKPENILFSQGLAIVADFGVAKAISSASQAALTRSGFPMGTIGYMSPEQAAGRADVDEKTDVFALACVAYELLIGETPGMWPTDEAVRLGRLVDALPSHRERLDRFPGRVEQVLTRALALRPADRFATPGAFADALVEASQSGEKLRDSEVREILERAAELEIAQTGEDVAHSIGAVEQIASEVGIAPAQVREATRAVRPPRDSLALVARGVAGGAVERRANPGAVDLRKSMLVADRVIHGEVPGSAHVELVNEIQDILGTVGHVSTVGGSLTWSPAVPGNEGRKILVTITPGAGETRIHVEERLELAGWKWHAPSWGAAGGAMVAWMLVARGGPAGTGAGFVVLVLVFAIAAGILTARGITRSMANWRTPEIQELVDRLAALAGKLALPGPGADSDPDNLPDQTATANPSSA
jgi:tRNA A-37 threonylcarbamoyl transferase component Bud32